MNQRFRLTTALLSMAAFTHAPVALGEDGAVNPQTPIIMEGGTGLDPCGNGYVKGLDPQGDGWLAVKSAPNIKAKRIDKIYNGQEVYVCEQRGDWIGIVYTTRRTADCNTMSPWTATLPYTGPCRSGWAHRKYIDAYAG